MKKGINWLDENYLKIIVICLIGIAYMTGNIYGFIIGVKTGSEKNGGDLCETLERERDEEGYCILRDNQRYEIKIDCGWEKFRVIGEREMNWFEKMAYFSQRIVYYPALRC